MSLGGILKIVGGIAAIVLSGGTLGVVAGAMLIASGAADMGLIGGSLGKFLKSSTFQYMTMAVGLGGAAMAAYGSSAAQAGATAAGQTAQAATTPLGAAGQGVLQSGATVGEAADMQGAAMTNMSFLHSADMVSEVAQAQLADPALSAVSGVSQATTNAMSQKMMGTGVNAEASQAAAQQTATTEAAGKTLPGGSPAGPGMKAMAPQGAGEGGAGVTPGTPAAGALETETPGGTINASGGYDVADSAAPAAAKSGWSGVLTNALNSKAGAAAIQGAGSMIGGIGNGMAQKQMMEDQLKAAQWGNMQWQNQGQVDKMQAAAAQPITVPQGYLQRAQQTRSLMQGNQGMQPLPAASPGAPLAPSPVHV